MKIDRMGIPRSYGRAVKENVTGRARVFIGLSTVEWRYANASEILKCIYTNVEGIRFDKNTDLLNTVEIKF